MKKLLLVALMLVLALAITALPVLADIDLSKPPSDADKATFDKILEPVLKIYTFVKYIATAIAGIILLLAGISYMTSGSDPKKRDTAKGIVMYVLIGLIIIWGTPFAVKYLIG